MTTSGTVTLQELLARFVASVNDDGDRRAAQEELLRFVRWYGRERSCSELAPPEVEQYARDAASSATSDVASHLGWVKALLGFAYRQGLTPQNLGSHVRFRRDRVGPGGGGRRARSAEPVHLTPEGRARLQRELESLRERRTMAGEEIRRAAGDKDVRENAPLEAARERQGMLEARIRELEGTLAAATEVPGRDRDDGEPVPRVRLGGRVDVRDLSTAEERSYLVVGPKESNLAEGKLSAASPVGRALLDRSAGERIQVQTPRGTAEYLVTRVEAP